jgi:putative NIF3 family GTP cyclohydrolase 1 type 2
MAYTARDVAHVFEEIAPLSSGLPGDQLGFLFGEPDQEVSGVACLWAAHTTSIRAAVEQELNMLICHEALWSDPDDSPWYAVPPVGEIVVNELRRKLLERHGVVVYRAHSNWDALPADGVPDQAVAALGIARLREVARERFFSVQELPEPMSVRELREQAGQGLGFDACRVFGDENQVIHRFAFLIGGFGENQLHMPQVARALGAEALIIGEMSEFIVIDALEMGLPVIETLHSVSESPAIRRQAAMLAERVPGLPVRFVPSGALAFR